MKNKRVSFSKTKRLEVFNKSDGRCWYCGAIITLESFHVDHYYPLSRGGANDIDNLVPACASCNITKNDKPIWEWACDVATEYGQALTPGQIKMIRSEGLDLLDHSYNWEIPVVFYHCQYFRSWEWCKNELYIKYKGWEE